MVRHRTRRIDGNQQLTSPPATENRHKLGSLAEVPGRFNQRTSAVKDRLLIQFAGLNQVTQILSQIERGEKVAAEKLLPLVYDELRRLAAQRLSHESPGQTLQATALVHEAYLRLVDVDQLPQWNGRGHFFAAAAEAMRRILVENARRKRSLKAGGDWERVDLAHLEAAIPGENLDLLALNEALDKLRLKDERQADLVNLRFFAGLTNDEAAAALGIAPSTADSDWAYARCWLRLEMGGGGQDGDS
jgi:RNA polymerase sigma factor (TIGR02999 family)